MSGEAAVSRRGLLEGLESPRPIAPTLPSLYQEDELTLLLVSAFDEIMAPILVTLDSLEAYVDPALCPDDFLDWLAGWIGLVPDENWTVERRRKLAARAVPVYRLRGTVAGLVGHVELLFGERPEVTDSGGVAWSVTPGADLPGSPEPRVTVKVGVPRDVRVDFERLQALIAAETPAHVISELEVAGA
ncbi:MAG TPA: phage tail protein [Gaiellales bacterium]